MFKIEQITNDPFQEQTLTLFDGSTLSIQMRYYPLQFGWFFSEITWNDFVLEGFRITNSPNMLAQFKNIIGFGLACITKENREPTQLDDFSSGNAEIFILDDEEVKQYSKFLSDAEI